MCYSDNWGNPDLFALICGRPRYRDVALFPFGGFEHQEVVWRKYNGFHPRGWAIFLERLGNASRNWFSIQLQYISNHMYVSFRNVVNLLVWPPCQLSDGSWHWKLPRELSTNTPLDDEIDYFYFHCAKCTLVHICRNAHCFRPSAGVYIYIYTYIYIYIYRKGWATSKTSIRALKSVAFFQFFYKKKNGNLFYVEKIMEKKKGSPKERRPLVTMMGIHWTIVMFPQNHPWSNAGVYHQKSTFPWWNLLFGQKKKETQENIIHVWYHEDK